MQKIQKFGSYVFETEESREREGEQPYNLEANTRLGIVLWSHSIYTGTIMIYIYR
jgi:hypothetical protein